MAGWPLDSVAALIQPLLVPSSASKSKTFGKTVTSGGGADGLGDGAHGGGGGDTGGGGGKGGAGIDGGGADVMSHATPASSLCQQLCTPQPAKGHSASVISVPMQAVLSIQMGSTPSPKYAKV